MTELTGLDWTTLGLLLLLMVGWGSICLKYLARGDRERNRGNQCPPHDWAGYYADLPDGTYKFVGLRCGKCKRTPGSLPNGESWTGGGGGLPLP